MKSTRRLLQDLYRRTGPPMNSGDPEVERLFGRMAAEYIGETLHQSFEGHEMDDWKKRRAVMKMFADMELCFQMMDEERIQSRP